MNLNQLHNQELKLLLKHYNFKNKRVLDVGCGRGELTSKLGKYCKEIIGIDSSIKKLKQAKKSKKVKYKKALAEKLPFKDKSFDCIIIIVTLHHMKNKNKILREIKRVLKDKGKLIILESGIHTKFEKICKDLKKEYPIRKQAKLYLNKQRILKKELYKIVEFKINGISLKNTFYIFKK